MVFVAWDQSCFSNYMIEEMFFISLFDIGHVRFYKKEKKVFLIPGVIKILRYRKEEWDDRETQHQRMKRGIVTFDDLFEEISHPSIHQFSFPFSYCPTDFHLSFKSTTYTRHDSPLQSNRN